MDLHSRWLSGNVHQGWDSNLNLTFEQIKELIAYGQELGLQQLQTDTLVVVYGQRAVLAAMPHEVPPADSEDAQSITKYYAALGRDSLKR